MADYATKKDVQEIVGKAINKAVDDLSEVIAGFASQVDTRFNILEKRADGLDQKFDKLLNTIDGFLKRLDEVETEQTVRDAQFEKLLEWAREVSEKTGIPLKGF